jgi:hypothetical protein
MNNPKKQTYNDLIGKVERKKKNKNNECNSINENQINK